jgi:hypothetical protein
LSKQNGLRPMLGDASSPRAERSGLQRAAIPLLALLQVLVPLLPGLGVGEPIGERSDSVRTLITPAGWAFSIWGPLYAGSWAYAFYQALPGQKESPLLARIGWASAGAFLGNAAWALYTQSYGLSAISALIILFTLFCLLSVYRAFAAPERGFTRGEQLFVVLPLSALASWLTAATIVNIAASAKYHGISFPAAAPAIAAAVLAAGGIIAALAVHAGRGNPWYAGVFLWALGAIFAAGGRAASAVAIAAVGAGLLVLLAALLRLAQREDRRHWLTAPPRA